MHFRLSHRFLLILLCLVTAALALSGCGLLFGSSAEPAATATASEHRALVPTFTPTTASPDTPTPPPAQNPQPVQNTPVVTVAQAVTTTTVTTATKAVTQTKATTPTATPAPKKAVLSITDDLVNVRNGPGTDYGLAGSANKGQQFDIIAKNQQGDWWQICCVNGQQVWVFGQLAKVENADSVPVAAQIPPKPVAQAPTAPPPTAPPAAAPPTATPKPEVKAAPAADPCANIGGDGCKWKLRDGPKFGANSGELKLQLLFIHSGNGNEAQGSYFVVLLKDGVKLPISDSVRSIARDKSQGGLGEYNYEYKIPLSDLPGNNVAGNYTIFVLDGNGERDSKDFSFSVPDGQGEIWIKFDQA
ncbi:MAG: SH3 domain-containing protein [Caldilineaceae bacterium]